MRRRAAASGLRSGYGTTRCRATRRTTAGSGSCCRCRVCCHPVRSSSRRYHRLRPYFRCRRWACCRRCQSSNPYLVRSCCRHRGLLPPDPVIEPPPAPLILPPPSEPVMLPLPGLLPPVPVVEPPPGPVMLPPPGLPPLGPLTQTARSRHASATRLTAAWPCHRAATRPSAAGPSHISGPPGTSDISRSARSIPFARSSKRRQPCRDDPSRDDHRDAPRDRCANGCDPSHDPDASRFHATSGRDHAGIRC